MAAGKRPAWGAEWRPSPPRRCPSVTRASSQTRRGAADPTRSATVAAAQGRVSAERQATAIARVAGCSPARTPALPATRVTAAEKGSRWSEALLLTWATRQAKPRVSSPISPQHLQLFTSSLFLPQGYPPLACVHPVPRCFSLCWVAFIPHSRKQFVDTVGHKNVLWLIPMSFRSVTNFRALLFKLTYIYKNRICFGLLDWQYLLLNESLNACEDEGKKTFSYTFLKCYLSAFKMFTFSGIFCRHER